MLSSSTSVFRRTLAAIVGGCFLAATVPAVAIVALVGPPPALAATIYWDGTTATWSTTAAWSTSSSAVTPNPSAAPGILDDAIFNITGANSPSTITLGADQAARSLTFNTTGGATILAGGTARTLTLGPSGMTLASGAGAVTLGDGSAGNNVLVRLRGGQTWTGSSASTVTINNTAATFTRATGASLTFNQASTGVFAMSTTVAPNVNGILGPWAFFGTGANTKYATNTTGTITGLTGTAAANATNLTDTTGLLNYDLASGTGTIGAANFSANTIRYTGGAATTAPGATAFSVNGLLNAGSGVWTIGNANPITIGSTKELVVNTANNGITISSRILDNAGGASSLTVLGSSTLALSGSNSFSGGVTLTRGWLQLQNSNAAGTGTILLAGNGALLLDPGITVANAVQVDLDVDRPSITANGGGNTALSGGITYTGTTNYTFPTINANSSGLFTISGGISAPNVTGAVSFRGTATGVVNGVISIPQGGLDLNGSANWTFNTAGGNYTNISIQAVSGGIILGVTDALATNALLNVNGNATGNLNMNGFNQTLAGLNGNAPSFSITNNSATADSTLTFSGLTGDRTFGGVIKDGATRKISLAMNSAGRAQILSATSTYTGTTTISAGTLRAGAAAGGQAFGNLSAVTISNTSGATLDLNSFSQTIGSLAGGGGAGGTITTGTLATAVLTTGGDNTSTTFAGVISGSGGLTKAGSGTQILSGANTYTGTTTINAGTLQIGNSGTTGALAASSAITGSSGGTLAFNRTDNYGGNLANTIGGGVNLSVAGSGTLTLSNANTYTGQTTVNGGVLAAGIANAFGSSAALAVNAGTVNLGGFSQAVGALSGSAGTLITTSTGAGSATLTATLASGTSTFAGSIADNGSGTVLFTKSGAGTQILSGTNTFSGATSIAAGILSITSTSGLQGTSGVSIAGGAGLTYTGGTATFGKNITVTGGTGSVTNTGGGLLTLSGTLSKDGTVLRLAGGAFNVTGSIVGSSSNSDLIVAGTSSVTLSAANTYNGPTFVIESSTLAYGINNAIPSNSGVTLGNATTRGTLALGSYSGSISQLVFSGSGGTVSLSGDKTAAAQLVTNGSLALGSNSSLVLTSAGTSAGLYRLISYTSLTGSFSPSNITGTPTGYSLLYTGTEIDLQQNAVFGTLSVTNPTAIITGGSAAFTYTVSNAAFSGGATLSFSGSGSSNVAGSSSGSALAGGTSSAISGLVFTGTTTGAGRTGTFSVTGAGTTQTGTVAVDVYGHASGSLSGNTIRVADSIVGYSGTLAGLTTATASNGAGYLVSLKTLGTTSAGGVSINNVSGVAAGSSATISAAVVTGSATGINAVNQQFTLTYADDSTLAGASNSLGSGTVTVQGNVFGHAAGSATGATIALADSIVGYTGSLAGLTSATISNAAGYRVNLMTTGGTSAGFVNINNVSGIAAGSSATISAAALLTGSQAVGANSLGQSFNLTYADDSLLAGASNNLGSQTVTVTGKVLDHATSSLAGTLLTDTTISLGQYNYATNTWESGGPTGLFSIFNLASSFGASLTADLSLLSVTGTGNGFTTNLASYSNIAGGTSSQFSIFFDPSGLSSSTTKSTTFQIAMSDKTGMAGATSTNTLSVTAQVIVVPEPGAIALAGIGIAVAAWAFRRKCA